MSAATAARIDVGRSEAGYVVVPLLDQSAVARLIEGFDALGVDPETPRFVSTVHCDLATGQAVDRALQHELTGPIQALVGDYQPFLAAYFAKGAHQGERMHFHQDLTYTDERFHRAVLAWIPLVDVDASNGAMDVVPGSHRWSHGIRPGRDDDAPPTDPHREAFACRSVSLAMRAGEALLYDPALVHGTPPNRTPRTRPVAGIALAPAGASLVHFRRADDGGIEGASIGPDGHLIDAFLGSLEAFEPLAPWGEMVAPEDFAPYLEGDPVPPGGVAGRAEL